MSNDSTLPRRLLGRKLLEMREKKHMSRAEVGKQLGIGQNTVWRYESGQIAQMKPMVIRALCQAYDANQKLTVKLLELMEQARKPYWWHSYGDAIPADFELFVGLEQSAERIEMFGMTLLPGLLQTAGYRRAMLRAVNPSLSEDAVERRIELVTKRQARLDDPNFTFHAVIDESALRRVGIGGPEVMFEQMQHLVTAGRRDNVKIRVIPLAAKAHLGLETGPFLILYFPRHALEWMNEPPMVYLESFTGSLHLGDETEVGQYRDAYAAIEKVALSEARSQALILRIAKEYV